MLGRKKGEKASGVVITFSVFLILFNPVSIYISLSLFLVVLLFLIGKNGSKLMLSSEGFFLWLVSLFLVVVVCVATILNGTLDLYVLLKYLRTSLYIMLFMVFISLVDVGYRKLINAFSFCLLFHVVLVVLQTVHPEIYKLSSFVFGLVESDNIDFLDVYRLRKPGATNSFDTASILSLCSLLLYYLRYKYCGNIYYIIPLALSFFSALLSSRLGIFFAISMMLYILYDLILKHISSRFLRRLALVSPVVFGVFLLISFDGGLIEYVIDAQELLFGGASGYGTYGTYYLLTGAFLDPLNVPFNELIIGYGIDPGSFGTLPSDIGYVKLAYHVGLVGALIIVVLHLNFFRHFVVAHKKSENSHEAIFHSFFACLIPFLLLFNYKSLEIYSRGLGDFVLFVYIFSTAIEKKHGQVKGNMVS